ncbi:cell wall-binding repeat-containing protein [Herbiconiux liukaitaii]|uniref:cell wall-binding repeat-containing protein n=1 Tax=Herbiconiux liukaitaii TaxID=3342799 RepID=UPI0035B73774
MSVSSFVSPQPSVVRSFRRLVVVAMAATLVAIGAVASPTADAASASASASAEEFTPGQQTRFPLPDRASQPTGIVTGADGALWIAESKGGITRMSTDGTTTRPIPSGAHPTDLAASPDGTIWWVAEADNQYGLITAEGRVEHWTAPTDAAPKAVTVAEDGTAWFIKPGAYYKLEAMRSPVNPAGYSGLLEIGHGVTFPTSVEAIGGKIWVSDSAARLIVVFSQTGVYERTISISAPGAMTAGDGGVYVVSSRSDIIKLNLDGSSTGIMWSYDFPLITDVVVPQPGELWFTQQRNKRITVRSLVPGIPSSVDLPDVADPSDLTVGPDGAIWYTTASTGEVVRVARDYEAPGFENVPSGSTAPAIRSYVGEPLGPVVLNDASRGSGTVRLRSLSTPVGMKSVDEVLLGTPSAVQSTVIEVIAENRYYNATDARTYYSQPIDVRARPATDRVAGADRYEVAVNASKAAFPAANPVVYLASGEKFTDALSAGSVAVQKKAPLLLTSGSALPSIVKDELLRLKPSRIVIVGGPASVSPAVQAQLSALALPGLAVERVGGADRYEVSRALVASTARSTTQYIAAGSTFPDALSATPVASAAGSSVMLVNGAASSVPAESVQFFKDRGVTTVKVAGGPASVSDGILQQLADAGITTVRLGGATRYEASVAINRDALTFPDTPKYAPPRAPTDPAILNDRDVVYLASGNTFPDALSGGVAAGLAGAPLYVVQSSCIPRPVLLDIGSTGATKVVILGGTATLAVPIDDLTVCP